MTLTKAIEILTIGSSEVFLPKIPSSFDALELAIEAMKRVEEYRSTTLCEYGALLPGETE